MLGYLLKNLFTGGIQREYALASALDAAASRKLYLDLMQEVLQDRIYEDPSVYTPWFTQGYSAEARETGRDWPSRAHTMIGNRRLQNLRMLTEDVLKNGVPGDFIETGVWRGGACILMRAVLKAYGIADRRVWVADSFRGLPPPDEAQYPADKGLHLEVHDYLSVSLARVKANFAKYGLLDDQVEFLEGWFRDTLPRAPVERLAVLRLDGDLYESTIVALDALYRKLSPGGFVIIDDYNGFGIGNDSAYTACRTAVADFRAREGIQDAIRDIDGSGVFWQKTA
jgi:Macrocin-O-methyltransferase (TylF)